MLESNLKMKVEPIRGLKTGWLHSDYHEKPILLFLHGFPDNAHVWEPLIEKLSDKYFCLAPFVRGVGPSQKGQESERFGILSICLDWLDLLKRYEFEKRGVVIVSHDMGVPVSWELAKLCGPHLRGLITMNGLSLSQYSRRVRKTPKQLIKSWYIWLTQIPYLPEFAVHSFGRQILDLADKLGNRPSDLKLGSVSEIEGLNAYPQYREFFKVDKSFLKKQKIEAPVLVLWGKHDGFLTPPSQDEFAKEASKTTVRILDANHWIFYEKSEDVQKHIIEFLGDIKW